MNRREACLAVGLMGGGGAHAQSGRRLRFAIGQSWGPPFLERVGTRVIGGLLPDLAAAIAAEAGMGVDYVMLPPARVDVALKDGSVDLFCLLSPTWAPELQGSARWTQPIVPLRDVLVAGTGGPATAAAFDAGARWTLAGVRGYRYPSLQGDLDRGRLVREDTLDQWGVLHMLARGRTQVGVVNEITLAAYRHRNAQAPLRQLRVIEEIQGHCLIGERPAVPPAQIHEAVRRLLSRGRLAEVLEPYQ